MNTLRVNGTFVALGLLVVLASMAQAAEPDLESVGTIISSDSSQELELSISRDGSDSDIAKHEGPEVKYEDRWETFGNRDCRLGVFGSNESGTVLNESSITSYCNSHGIEAWKWMYVRTIDGVQDGEPLDVGGCTNCHHVTAHSEQGLPYGFLSPETHPNPIDQILIAWDSSDNLNHMTYLLEESHPLIEVHESESLMEPSIIDRVGMGLTNGSSTRYFGLGIQHVANDDTETPTVYAEKELMATKNTQE